MSRNDGYPNGTISDGLVTPREGRVSRNIVHFTEYIGYMRSRPARGV